MSKDATSIPSDGSGSRFSRLFANAAVSFLTIYCSNAVADQDKSRAGHDIEYRITKDIYLPEADHDRPLVGQSLFDDLFYKSTNVGNQYQIPYPFKRILEVLESKLGLSINEDPNKVKTTLIPLGRCINRYAAAPEYFKFPRIVVAVDSEHHGSKPWAERYLKDQIFLGYQKKAKSIELISYNDALGRFEFQVVSNYAEGQTPSVHYVKREHCTVCHQNQGPIFARSLWDETDGNGYIFELMAAAQPSKNDTPIINSSNRVADVDSATNRANMFSIFQDFWKGSCVSQDGAQSVQCRAGVFKLVLQSKLSETRRALPKSEFVSRFTLPLLSENSEKLWQEGISVHSSDINNQSPIEVGEQLHLRSAENLKLPRSIMIVWQPDNLYRVVQGLGGFIPLSDIRRLDKAIFQNHQKPGAPRINISGPCWLQRTDDRTNSDEESQRSGEISIKCELSGGVVDGTVGIAGSFDFKSGVMKPNSFLNRIILDRPDTLMSLSHDGGTINTDSNRSRLRLNLYDARNQLHARLPDGQIIDKIEIKWHREEFNESLFEGSSTITGSASLTVLPEMEILDQAIKQMITNDKYKSAGLFSSRPFRGRLLMDALHNEIARISVN